MLDEEDVARTVHSMGTSLLGWTQSLLRRELFHGDARVLGLTSEGNAVAWSGYAAVSAAKAALEALSRSLAVELAPFGVRCNVVQPGVTDTPALRLIPGSDRLRRTRGSAIRSAASPRPRTSRTRSACSAPTRPGGSTAK